MRPARRPLLVAACLVSLAAGATRLAAQSSADVSVQCDRAGNPAFPDARARVQAAAGQGGAAGAFAQGCLALGEGRYEPAASAFEQAVRADDRAAAYHYFLGRAYGAQAQRASMMSRASLARKTKAEFERAVQLDPEFLDAREGLMQYYLQAPGFMGGSPQKAREQAHEVRKRAPYRGALLYATLAARDKDLAGAVRELDGMTRQFPDSTAPYVQLAVLQSQQKNWPAVWAAVDRLGRARPDAPAGWYAAGRAAAESGEQLDRGAGALARYLATTPAAGAPTLGAAHWRLGMIRERQGRRDDARAEYEAAVRLDPRLKDARAALDRLR
jgi:tetratricopeptide (TPR) repeat protein